MSTGHRLFSSSVMLTVAALFAKSLALLSMPILTRLLNPEVYGQAALITSMVSLLAVISLCGIDMSYSRLYHSERFKEVQLETFVWSFAIICSMFFGLVGALVWSSVSFAASDISGIPAMIFALITLTSLLTVSRVQKKLMENYIRLAFGEILLALITTFVTIFVAYFYAQNVLSILIGTCSGLLIANIILARPKISAQSILPTQNNFNVFREILGVGIAGVLTAPIFWVIVSSDRWILGYYSDATTIGVYSIAFSIAMLATILNGSITAIWLPEASKIFESKVVDAPKLLGEYAEKLIFALMISWLAVTAAGFDVLRLLAAPEFVGSPLLIPLLAGGIFFNSVMQLANAGALLALKLWTTVKWMVAGGAISLALNLILISYLQEVGAAITQLVAFSFISLGVWFENRKKIVLPKPFRTTLGQFFLVCIMGLLMFPAWSDKPLISLVVKLPVGIFFTISMTYIFYRKDAKKLINDSVMGSLR